MEHDIFKVTSSTNPNQLAGAIAGTIRNGHRLEIQMIGAGAINQAVKAIAIARGFLAPTGIQIACMPAFTEVIINGQTRTGIKIQVDADNMQL